MVSDIRIRYVIGLLSSGRQATLHISRNIDTNNEKYKLRITRVHGPVLFSLIFILETLLSLMASNSIVRTRSLRWQPHCGVFHPRYQPGRLPFCVSGIFFTTAVDYPSRGRPDFGGA